jgi:hypothetical protein
MLPTPVSLAKKPSGFYANATRRQDNDPTGRKNSLITCHLVGLRESLIVYPSYWPVPRYTARFFWIFKNRLKINQAGLTCIVWRNWKTDKFAVIPSS